MSWNFTRSESARWAAGEAADTLVKNGYQVGEPRFVEAQKCHVRAVSDGNGTKIGDLCLVTGDDPSLRFEGDYTKAIIIRKLIAPVAERNGARAQAHSLR